MNYVNNNTDAKAEYETNPTAFLEKMQKVYFKRGIELTKSLQVESLEPNYENQDAFAKAIGLDATEFYLDFGRDDTNELDEVRICFTLEKTPGMEKLRRCPERDVAKYRAKPFIVPDRTKIPIE